jgi:hypothetical protein
MKKSMFASSLVALTGAMVALLATCQRNTSPANTSEVTVAVDPTLFIAEGLAEPITKVTRTLSNGTSAECYKIVTKNTPTEHAVGPWCPTNIADDASKGGIWFEGGKLYDVDGAFVKNLASFYNDAVWKLYNADGSINVTNSKAACEAAARPNVDAAYTNYCVECQPSYAAGIKKTFYIPVRPVKLNASIPITSGLGGVPPGMAGGPPPGLRGGPPPPRGGGRGEPQEIGRGGHQGPNLIVGIAFNGVNFDPPAPTTQILGAHTIAPMDDAGGHVNPAAGYHYHVATGLSKKIPQSDKHAAMIGYAMDGYGLYEHLDSNGNEARGLDANRGHYDSKRGYHYHVAAPGTNSFIKGFRGAQGTMTISF